MASILLTDIESDELVIADGHGAESLEAFRSDCLSNGRIGLLQLRPVQLPLLHNNPTFSLLLSSLDSSQNYFFQAGCAFVPRTSELYVTSRPLQSSSSSRLPTILISLLKLTMDEEGTVDALEWKKLRPPPNMPMPAGVLSVRNGMLFCAQGLMVAEPSSGIYIMPPGHPPEPIVTSYYGQPFNGVYACALDQDENVWFVDSRFGFEDEFRPRPQVPCYLFRFEKDTSELRVMASGLMRPSGLAFSPDFRTLYVSDAGHTDKSLVDTIGSTA